MRNTKKMSASIIKLTAENSSHKLTRLDFDCMAEERLLLDTSTLLESGCLHVGDDSARNCHELSCMLWPNAQNRKPRLLHFNITHSNGPFGVFFKSTSHTSKYIKFRNSFEEAEDSECLIVNSYAFREHGTRITLLAEAEVRNKQIASVRFTVINYPYFNNEPFDDSAKLENKAPELLADGVVTTDEAALENGLEDEDLPNIL